MRRLLSLIGIFLLLSAATPAFACVMGTALTHEEGACCPAVQTQCGTMAKQGCCHMDIQVAAIPGVAATSPATSVHRVCFAQSFALAAPVRTIASAMLRMPEEQPPPGLLTAKFTVLRI